MLFVVSKPSPPPTLSSQQHPTTTHPHTPPPTHTPPTHPHTQQQQVIDPHSISAGLDYPGIGPEHSFLKDAGRAEYHAVTDAHALEGFQRLSQLEGIIPALETSHAIAYLDELVPSLPGGSRVVLNCSGRGDKDVNTAIQALNMQ